MPGLMEFIFVTVIVVVVLVVGWFVWPFIRDWIDGVDRGVPHKNISTSVSRGATPPKISVEASATTSNSYALVDAVRKVQHEIVAQMERRIIDVQTTVNNGQNSLANIALHLQETSEILLKQAERMRSVEAAASRLADKELYEVLYSQAKDEIRSLQKKNDDLVRQFEEVVEQQRKNTQKIETLNANLNSISNERDVERNLNRHYRELIPVDELRDLADCVSKTVAGKGSFSSVSMLNARIVMLMVLLRSELNDEEKRVTLRDAFMSFDSELNTLFATNPDVLAEVREIFIERLRPKLSAFLNFNWPRIGDAFNPKEHKADEENGKDRIVEVKSAVLSTASGALISKARVRT